MKVESIIPFCESMSINQIKLPNSIHYTDLKKKNLIFKKKMIKGINKKKNKLILLSKNGILIEVSPNLLHMTARFPLIYFSYLFR